MSGIDSRVLFAESVAAIARSLDAVDLVLVDVGAFTLDGVLHSGEAFRIHLHNLYASVDGLDGPARAAEVERATRAMFAPRTRPAAWADVEDRLVPTLRPADAFEDVDVIVRPAFGGLVEALAMDLRDSTAYITPTQLEYWGRPPDQAFDRARANLRTVASDGLDALHSRMELTVVEIAPGDVHAPSRLLLPGWLAGLRGALGGAPVAAVPTRTTLLVARADRPDLDAFAAAVRGLYETEPGPVSADLYTTDAGGGIVPFAP